MISFSEFVIIVLNIVGPGIWFWGIAEVVHNERGRAKFAWIALVIPTYFVGSSIYLAYHYRAELRDFFERATHTLRGATQRRASTQDTRHR